MFLNSVVLILHETLEAALLISVLLVFSKCCNIKSQWIFSGTLLGSIGALLFASNMANISAWFDYVGQEVFNALLQLSILLLLGLLALQLPAKLTSYASLKNTHHNSRNFGSNRWIMVCMVLAISLTITREGSEIFIYIGSAINQTLDVQPTLAGSGIGTGIGVSTGVLIYYGLTGLPAKKISFSSLLLLSLVGGNMASQATLLLTQADWLPYSPILWNSSQLLPENSIVGHLLYALVGYEATPSLFQFLSYLCGTLLILLCWLLGKLISSSTMPRPSVLSTTVKIDH